MFNIIKDYCLALGVAAILLVIFALGGVLLSVGTLMFMLVVIFWFIADFTLGTWKAVCQWLKRK